MSARQPPHSLAHKDCRSDHDLSLAAIEWLECRFVVGTASLIGSVERVGKNPYKISDGHHTVPLKGTACVAGNINLISVPSSENDPVRLKDHETTSIKRGGHPKMYMVVLAGIILGIRVLNSGMRKVGLAVGP